MSRQILRGMCEAGERLPHQATAQEFSARSQVLQIADAMMVQTDQAVPRAAGRKEAEVAVAVIATGMESSEQDDHEKIQAHRLRHRWSTEGFFIDLERTTGSGLSAGNDAALHHAAALRVRAYTLNGR
jgi:hypothetical protein